MYHDKPLEKEKKDVARGISAPGAGSVTVFVSFAGNLANTVFQCAAKLQ